MKSIKIFPLLILLFTPLLSQAQSVVRGPYLQTATPNSIIIKWRTDVATDSAVGYSAINGVPSTVSVSSLTTEHEVTLDGLNPDTLYNYAIGSTSQVLAGGDISVNGDGEHFFTTAPLTGVEKDTRIWVIGDSGTAHSNSRKVRDAYKSFTATRGADLWLMLGDNAYPNGTDDQYQAAVFDLYPQILRQVPLWSALGNHDMDDMNANPPGAYPQIFTFPTMGEAGGVWSGSERYYSFDYGNIHFISVDSSTRANRAVGSTMMSWLEADLIANTQDWTIVLFHHTPYTMQTGGAMREMRENALPLLESYGVDLVLSGHNHSYKRSFLIDGHYGDPETLTSAMILDDGDGYYDRDEEDEEDEEDEGEEEGEDEDESENEYEYGDAYIKLGPPGTPHEGTVYAVVGSSGTGSGDPFGHPTLSTQLNILGSMVLDISGNQLDAVFIDSAGAVRDEFTIIKSPPRVVDINVNPKGEDNFINTETTVWSDRVVVDVEGSETFDVGEIDAATVKFGPGFAEAFQSVGWNVNSNDDAHNDLRFRFRVLQTGITCEFPEDVELVGETFAGAEFIGTSSVTTPDCPSWPSINDGGKPKSVILVVKLFCGKIISLVDSKVIVCT